MDLLDWSIGYRYSICPALKIDPNAFSALSEALYATKIVWVWHHYVTEPNHVDAVGWPHSRYPQHEDIHLYPGGPITNRPQAQCRLVWTWKPKCDTWAKVVQLSHYVGCKEPALLYWRLLVMEPTWLKFHFRTPLFPWYHLMALRQ